MIRRIYPFLLLAGGLALLATLAACSDSWMLATREHANEVAANEAESAKTNPFSAVLQGVAGLVASLAGAGILIKRGITKYDNAPMERSDGSRVSEAEVADNIPRKA